jgi:hypothetical protein
MDDIEKKPTDFLKPEFHQEYEIWKRTIQDKLLSLNHAILYLGKITDFPFRILDIQLENRHFWQFQLHYLSEYIVIGIQRLITDRDNKEDLFTPIRFKEAVLGAMADNVEKAELERRLDKAGFETRLEQLRDRVNKTRHKYIGHLDRKLHLNPQPINKFTLEEFKELFNLGAGLYDELSLGHIYGRLVFDYIGHEHRFIDIDNLLTATAQKSMLVSFTPERLKDLKDLGLLKRFSDISDDSIRIINEYRVKARNQKISREDLTNDASKQ